MPASSKLVLLHNATLDGKHRARCDGMRLVGLVAGASLESVAEAVAEATEAAMQASSSAHPLPQQPVPDFPGHSARGLTHEQMQENARRMNAILTREQPHRQAGGGGCAVREASPPAAA